MLTTKVWKRTQKIPILKQFPTHFKWKREKGVGTPFPTHYTPDFQTFWPKWLNFFGHFKNISVCDRKQTVLGRRGRQPPLPIEYRNTTPCQLYKLTDDFQFGCGLLSRSPVASRAPIPPCVGFTHVHQVQVAVVDAMSPVIGHSNPLQTVAAVTGNCVTES